MRKLLLTLALLCLPLFAYAQDHSAEVVVDQTPWEQDINGGSYNLTTTGNITAAFFLGNGSQLTGITAVAGNPFNQVLNTTSDVTFNNITINNTIFTPAGTNLTLSPGGGNVGIGIIAPATTLDVNGTINATGGNSTYWNAKQEIGGTGAGLTAISGANVTGATQYAISNVTDTFVQRKINFKVGQNISSIVLVNDTTGNQVNVTINAIDTTGAGGGGDNLTYRLHNVTIGRQPIFNFNNTTSVTWYATNDTTDGMINITADSVAGGYTNFITDEITDINWTHNFNTTGKITSTGLIFPEYNGTFNYEIIVSNQTYNETGGIGTGINITAGNSFDNFTGAHIMLPGGENENSGGDLELSGGDNISGTSIGGGIILYGATFTDGGNAYIVGGSTDDASGGTITAYGGAGNTSGDILLSSGDNTAAIRLNNTGDVLVTGNITPSGNYYSSFTNTPVVKTMFTASFYNLTSPITPGYIAYGIIPNNITITSWQMLSDTNANASARVYLNTTGGPPTLAEEITFDDNPHLTDENMNYNSTISVSTTWNSGDRIGVNLTANDLAKSIVVIFNGTYRQ